jgi:splicing factor 3B subunit 1
MDGAGLTRFSPDDAMHFGKLMDTSREEADMDLAELKERKVLRLLLRIKNGDPRARRTAMRNLCDKAKDFGAATLFNNILPLLMAPSLEVQERHLLVKVIDRIMFSLDDLVRPFVHKILLVIEPMLIDEDYYARVEAKEIISNLSKAAGLATMISVMRPDIDHVDEYIRNTTSRAFAVVASALGVPALLPFLKAVCKSKKSWQARHTGAKIIQQIAVGMRSACLPHLEGLVGCIQGGLEDEEHKVRTMAALGVAGLAEVVRPYGIEAFEGVLRPLWEGVKIHRGKGLAGFLKAVGAIIPLMEAEHAGHFTRGVMKTLVREFQSPDDEMKKIVLGVVRQCVACEGVGVDWVKNEVLPDFFKAFWCRRTATDRRTVKELVETTVVLAEKVGANEVVKRIVDDLKDESEGMRKMVMEAIEKIVKKLGVVDIERRVEEVLIDGILFSFQEQTVEDIGILKGFGTVVGALGARAQPYLQQIVSAILWRLNNKSAGVRQQAADLVKEVAPVLKVCGEDKMLGTLGMVLYEYLGEEYPDVLGSIIGGLKVGVERV